MTIQSPSPTTQEVNMHTAINPTELVPLSLLSVELGVDVEELARRLGDDVTFDDIGLRSVAVDVARNVVTAHREHRLAVAAATDRNAIRTAALAEAYRPRLLKAPTATELAEAGYDSVAEFMAAQMLSDAELTGGRRRRVFEDALAGDEMVYRPIRDGSD